MLYVGTYCTDISSWVSVGDCGSQYGCNKERIQRRHRPEGPLKSLSDPLEPLIRVCVPLIFGRNSGAPNPGVSLFSATKSTTPFDCGKSNRQRCTAMRKQKQIRVLNASFMGTRIGVCEHLRAGPRGVVLLYNKLALCCAMI